MTREETKQMLIIMQMAYPNYKPQDKTMAINIWFEMLENYEFNQVKAALKVHILSDTSGFPPAIGQIVEKLQLFKKSDELNEFAAWQLVLKAMRNSIYHSEEEFEKLPPAVQKAVVSPGQLREWAMAEDIDGTWMNVTQSNFMRTYRAEAAKEKEMQKLSPDLLKLVKYKSDQIAESVHKEKELSVQEERAEAEKRAVPMPERLKAAYGRLMGVLG